MYTPARGYLNTPNLVYKSLDVGTRYFSTIKNFVIEMTLGHVVTLPLGHVVVMQIGRIFGVNRANCDTSTKVGMGHFYSY